MATDIAEYRGARPTMRAELAGLSAAGLADARAFVGANPKRSILIRTLPRRLCRATCSPGAPEPDAGARQRLKALGRRDTALNLLKY